MTKAAHIAATRSAPLGIAGIEAIRAILANHSAQKVNQVFIDAFSASAIVAVYDALKPENQAKLIAKPVAQVADICFKLLKS